MQANEDSKLFKNVFIYLGWILLALFLWFKGCGNDCGKTTTNVKVIVPEVKGSFEAKKPKNEPVVNGKNLSITDKSKFDKSGSANDSLIDALLAENEKLSRDFYLQSDSIKRGLYQKAIQLNKFAQTFDDENVKIDVLGISRGTVESLTANYRIKEKELKTEIAQKEVKFRMLAGGTVGNSIDFQKPVFQANIGFQNKKGNILRAGYDSEKRILIGYDFSIFKIHR